MRDRHAEQKDSPLTSTVCRPSFPGLRQLAVRGRCSDRGRLRRLRRRHAGLAVSLTPIPLSDPFVIRTDGRALSVSWAFGMQLIPLSLSLALILAKVHVPIKPLTSTPFQLLCRIDWLGFVCILTSITALMLSLSLATASGYQFSHPFVWGLLVLCAVSTVVFVVVEHKAAEPLVPMSLLKSWTPALVLIGFLLLTMSTFARVRVRADSSSSHLRRLTSASLCQLFEIPLYLHVVRGYDGTHTGLILLPSTVTGSAASLYAGWHMRRWGQYKTLTVVSSIFPILAAVSLIATWGLDVSVWRMATECALASWGGGYVVAPFPSPSTAGADLVSGLQSHHHNLSHRSHRRLPARDDAAGHLIVVPLPLARPGPRRRPHRIGSAVGADPEPQRSARRGRRSGCLADHRHRAERRSAKARSPGPNRGDCRLVRLLERLPSQTIWLTRPLRSSRQSLLHRGRFRPCAWDRHCDDALFNRDAFLRPAGPLSVRDPARCRALSLPASIQAWPLRQ